MSEEIARYGEDPKPLTALEIRAGVNLIQEVMKNVMQSGTHYGKIPGAGDKPTLLKPGAEKIMATFRLAPDPEITDLSANGYIRYQIKCRLISPGGRYLGAGVGEASTDEEKYKWRAVVSTVEWEATPETERRTKFKRDGWVKQIRTNPADLANTVLKMAKKRALVDAVLTVTAASDIFTQDIEDIPEEILQKKDSTKESPQANKNQVVEPDYKSMPPPSGLLPENKGGVITSSQGKRFWAIARENGRSPQDVRNYFDSRKIASTEDMLKEEYDRACGWAAGILEDRQPGQEG